MRVHVPCQLRGLPGFWWRTGSQQVFALKSLKCHLPGNDSTDLGHFAAG